MEQFGGLSVSNFQEIIENYEKLFKELTVEVDVLKSEQINLKLTTKTLLEENKRLSKNLQDVLEPKDGTVTRFLNFDNEIDTSQNLKDQINSLLAEKQYTTKLWQNSIQTIAFLEDELKVYQAGTHDYIPKKEFVKVKQNYEDKITALNSALRETQLKLDASIEHVSKQLGVKNQEIDKSLETQAGAFQIVKNLEDEILNLQKRLHELEKMRTKLEKEVKEKESNVQGVRQKNAECREKVKEAVLVVQAALNEKDAALFREHEAREEVKKLNETLSDIIKETEEKVKNEVVIATNEFNFKNQQLVRDLRLVQDEIKLKSLDIEKYSTKCTLLENEIEKLRKGNLNIDESNTSRLLILEKNLESTFQKLLVSEKQNIQLISERDTIKNDMEEMAGHYERVLKTKEVEKINFQSKIQHLQEYLDESNANLTRTTESLAVLNSKLESVEKEYHVQKETDRRIITETYSNKITELNSAYNVKVRELQNELESKSEINKRWVTETKIVIENLEKLIADLKSEVHSLKKQNMKLREKLQESNGKVEQYKGFLQLISKDVNKISTMTLGTGNVT